jgi:hypothetical protein
LIREVIIPESIKMRTNWFELYARNDTAWIEELDTSLAPFGVNRHLESLYIWDASLYLGFKEQYNLPDNVEIESAEVPILPERLRDASLIPACFLSRGAIGCRAKVMGRDVALCRSNGFEAGNEFMIDVITFDVTERNKGYATAASVGLLDYCLENRLHPLWETTEDNTASRRLAQKLGFVEEETYPVFAIEF